MKSNWVTITILAIYLGITSINLQIIFVFNSKGLPTQDNEHRKDALIVFKKFMFKPSFYTTIRIGNNKLNEHKNYESVLEE